MYVNVLMKNSLSTSACRRRVVVTGTGLVTCLGVGVHHVWERLIRGDCGIETLKGKEYEQIPCRVAGVVPKGEGQGCLSLDAHVTPSDQRGMSLATCYALVAASEALRQAGWQPSAEVDRVNTGVAVGMGISPLDVIADTGRALAEQGYRSVSPHFVPRILTNMAAGQISIKYGFQGPNHAVSTACTTGVHAIGDAMRFIQHGDAKVMLCGSAEASVCPLGMAGFARMRALSTSFNDEPHSSSRPFDRDREGFVMSEGAGIMVLEDYDHARSRGATIIGEVLGYGLSADAKHITTPSEDGRGAYRCMQSAILDAGLEPRNIGYINAHATATPLGDAAEAYAIKRLRDGHSGHDVVVSSTKGAVGHLLGAAGSVEAIFTLMACHTGVAPPTLNCHHPDPRFELNFSPLESQPWPPSKGNQRIALTNSFGFGGTNASLCLGSITE